MELILNDGDILCLGETYGRTENLFAVSVLQEEPDVFIKKRKYRFKQEILRVLREKNNCQGEYCCRLQKYQGRFFLVLDAFFSLFASTFSLISLAGSCFFSGSFPEIFPECSLESSLWFSCSLSLFLSLFLS